jgi:F-type H+-transporting ATPase subunit gamma
MNSALSLRVMEEVRRWREAGRDVFVVSVGSKCRDAIRRAGVRIESDFSEIDEHITGEEVSPIALTAVSAYLEGRAGEVYLAYTDFVNTLTQKPTVRRLLPVSLLEREGELKRGTTESDAQSGGRIFEPSLGVVADRLIPRLIETEIYKALLDHQASEHSARMVAMKNATEKAGELIDDLQLAYNQSRQAAITSEIAEISSAAMATG